MKRMHKNAFYVKLFKKLDKKSLGNRPYKTRTTLSSKLLE